MAVEHITMPQLGESVTEGTISQWLVSAGDKVNKYDPLAEVLTDKVNAEIPSSYTGVIKDLIAKEGETISVGELICTIEVEDDDSGVNGVQNRSAATEVAAPAEQGGKARYSPAVLKLSQEHGIDLLQVHGTGAGGRITRKDLLALIETRKTPKASAAPSTPDKSTAAASETLSATRQSVTVPAAGARIQTDAGDIAIPLTGMRKAIAANMLRSKHEVPHAWTMIEVDVTDLVNYRNRIKNEFKQKEGYPLTFFAFFVKAVAQALKEVPQMNSMWAGDKIIHKKEINISIAVAVEDALYVPVIKHADEKSIKGIARDIAELAAKARNGKLTADDSHGGTFTVNNTGSFGSVQSMGIINYPQAAILQVETIVKRPVVLNGNMIAIRDMVNLCLSIDHRILDGLVSGRFMQRVKEILEHTSESTTPVY